MSRSDETIYSAMQKLPHKPSSVWVIIYLGESLLIRSSGEQAGVVGQPVPTSHSHLATERVYLAIHITMGLPIPTEGRGDVSF